VKNNIDVKVIENLSPFENKILESLTIQLTYPDNRCYLLTSIYRSNGIIPNVTPAQQMDRFLEILDELFNNIRLSRKESFIFLDANIDLLDLNNGDTFNYMNMMLNHGFLQCIGKATRMQNQSKSLIDHIMISSNTADIVSGTVLCDISDHFITFVCIPGAEKLKQQHKTITSRDFSLQNPNNFKTALGMEDWHTVLSQNDIDLAYNEFWSIYTKIYEANFPKRRIRFNRNRHKINKFMTAGLLISRESKNKLHKIALADPSELNINRYKAYNLLTNALLERLKNFTFNKNLNRMPLVRKKRGKH